MNRPDRAGLLALAVLMSITGLLWFMVTGGFR